MTSVSYKSGVLRAPSDYMEDRGSDLCKRIGAGLDDLMPSYLAEYDTFAEAVVARVRSDYVNWASVRDLFGE